MKDDSAAIRRAAIERWLATAAFNAYFRFRVGALGEGTCTLEVPFHEEFLRPGDVVSGPVFMAAADAATFLSAGAGSPIVQAASLAGLFFLAALPSCFVWLAFGAAVQHVLHNPRRLRIFNAVMGALLALSIVLIVR